MEPAQHGNTGREYRRVGRKFGAVRPYRHGLTIGGLGFANRLVIFRDWGDLAWSCASRCRGIAGGGAYLSLLVSLASAVHGNGVVLGLAVFKLGIALLILVLVLPRLLGRRNVQGRPITPNFLLLRAVAGLVYLLVNSNRVAARRRVPTAVVPRMNEVGGTNR